MRLKRRRQLIAYIFFVLLALALVMLSANRDVVNNRLNQYLSGVMSHAFVVLNFPVKVYKDAATQISQHFYIVSENRRLKRHNEALLAWQAEALFLRGENDTLRDLLNMTSNYNVEPVATRVLVDSNSPYAHSVLVNSGKNQNISKGQAALTARGLVGRVIDVGKTTSRILLLHDHNSRIPVKVLETGERAILKGNSRPRLELILTDSETHPRAGLRLVTSGAGGIFAPGLPVGKVYASGKRVTVQPYANLAHLDMLVIHRREVTGILGQEGE